MQSNLRIDATEGLSIDNDPIEAGVARDLRVYLSHSRPPGRLMTYCTRRGTPVELLGNDFDLPPGWLALHYSRRWGEENCFDTWKNDRAQVKLWGKVPTAIEKARLASSGWRSCSGESDTAGPWVNRWSRRYFEDTRPRSFGCRLRWPDGIPPVILKADRLVLSDFSGWWPLPSAGAVHAG